MMLNKNSLTQREVLDILKNNFFVDDLNYNSGKVIGSMVGSPKSFAERIYSMCLEKDVGLTSVFSGTREIEKEAISMIGSILSNSSASGHIVSGGTEANLTAMWAARNMVKKKNPEVIVSKNKHFSFNKISDLLNITIREVPSKNFKADPEKIENKINENTIAIVATAGTTELGLVDPIEKIAKIANDNDLYLHIDAAFGGFVIPFLKKAGYNLPDFDFKLDSVCSITIDPHKYLRIPPPAGGILFRDKSYFGNITTEVDYLEGNGAPNRTILGTRPAAPAITTWAVLKKMGLEGLKEEVRYSMEITNLIYNKLKKLDHLCPITKPEMNIIGIKSDILNPKEISKQLEEESGFVLFPFKNSARIVILPYLIRAQIEELIIALEKLDKKLGG